jgi:hypothetical protein
MEGGSNGTRRQGKIEEKHPTTPGITTVEGRAEDPTGPGVG